MIGKREPKKLASTPINMHLEKNHVNLRHVRHIEASKITEIQGTNDVIFRHIELIIVTLHVILQE